MVHDYIVYEDSSGDLGAIPYKYGKTLKDITIDLWMEGKTVLGCPAARSKEDAIIYISQITEPSHEKKRK